MAASAGDDDAVQRRVDLAVAAAIKPAALGVARAGWDRCDGRASELGRRGEALDPGDLTDELGDGQRPKAGLVEQLRRDLPNELGDLALEGVMVCVSSRTRRSSSRAIRTRIVC